MFVVVFLFHSTRLIFHALLIMKIPCAGTDSVSEVLCKHSKWFSRGKIKFLKWLLLKSFFFLFLCTLAGADRTFLYHAIAIERGVMFPAFSILYSCSLRSPSQMEGWRSTTRRSNPNISAWQRPRPSHWDKTEARSVRYHYKWFLCLIRNSCCTLLPAGRC